MLAILGIHSSRGSTAEEALQSFELQEGLRIELVASEPLTSSPCAMAFDGRGRLFVAENRGYPRGPAEGESPMGIISLLEDTDHDGRMDKRTVFADGLSFPNGVLPWKDGLLVTCAPDLLFLRDTNGDGRADEKQILLTGFDTQKSTQLRVNGPTVGPDGWIWMASGLSGGVISNPNHPELAAIELKTDLRFDPISGRFEAVPGQSQFGHSFDSAGRRFICMNRLQVQHVVMPFEALRRNPNFAFSETVQKCPEVLTNHLLRGGNGAARIFPISQNITTADAHAGTFSAACAVTIWQGGGLPNEYNGIAFSCDPTGNLIHADRLEERGPSFAALPFLPSGNNREFVASRDDWFRPVFITSGPDGALYVCDMTRRVIEHPDYLPEEVRKHTDFESGRDLGRIWRITRQNAPPAKVLISSAEKTPNLIKRLGSPSSWERTTAYRMLVEADPGSFANELEAALNSNQRAEAVVSLLWLARRTNSLDESLLLQALRHREAAVREVALTLLPSKITPVLTDAVQQLANDIDGKVRFRTALALGALGSASEQALASLARRDGKDKWTSAAILAGTTRKERSLLTQILENPCDIPDTFIGQLTKLVAKTLQPSERAGALEMLLEKASGVGPAAELAVATGFSEGLPPRSKGSLPFLERALSHARSALASPGPARILAIELLGATDFATAGKELLQLLAVPDTDLQSAAVSALARFNDRQTAAALLEAHLWESFSPILRDKILNALTARPALAEVLIDEIEKQRLPAGILDSRRRQVLLASRDPQIKKRASALFTNATDGDRMKAFESAKDVLSLASHSTSGRDVFRRLCVSCHRMDREGYAVGPDLFDISRQTKENILLHIVVPEYEIAPGFASYVLETNDGRTLLGVISSETPESVTVRQPGGQQDTILRPQIRSIKASAFSLMPQGLEKVMQPQELADLLAYLRGEQ